MAPSFPSSNLGLPSLGVLLQRQSLTLWAGRIVTYSQTKTRASLRTLSVHSVSTSVKFSVRCFCPCPTAVPWNPPSVKKFEAAFCSTECSCSYSTPTLTHPLKHTTRKWWSLAIGYPGIYTNSLHEVLSRRCLLLNIFAPPCSRNILSLLAISGTPLSFTPATLITKLVPLQVLMLPLRATTKATLRLSSTP